MAEPQKLRDKFNEAIEDGHPIMSRIRLDTMVAIMSEGRESMVWHAVAVNAASVLLSIQRHLVGLSI